MNLGEYRESVILRPNCFLTFLLEQIARTALNLLIALKPQSGPHNRDFGIKNKIIKYVAANPTYTLLVSQSFVAGSKRFSNSPFQVIDQHQAVRKKILTSPRLSSQFGVQIQ